MLDGGAQERGLRAGTENVVGVMGMGVAAEGVGARVECMPRVAALRDGLERGMEGIEGVVINGAERRRVLRVRAMLRCAGSPVKSWWPRSISRGSACRRGRRVRVDARGRRTRCGRCISTIRGGRGRRCA